MGGESSKGGEKTILNLKPEERVCIQQIYQTISDGQTHFSKEQFQTYTSKHQLDESLSSKLFGNVLHNGDLHSSDQSSVNPGSSSIGEFEVMCSKLLKGCSTEKVIILRKLSSKNLEASATELQQCLCSLLRSYVGVVQNSIQYQTWKCHCAEDACDRLVRYLLQDLFQTNLKHQSGDSSQCVPVSVSYSDFVLEDWFVKSPMTQHIFDLIFHSIFPIDIDNSSRLLKPMIPVVTDTNWTKFNTILGLEDIMYLHHTLPASFKSEWRLLFSNTLYGDSFTQLVSHIVKKGPNLLVIRDKDGYVFGGFNNEGWEINSKFSGSSNCYLFTLQPQCSMYTATGYNSNFVYFNKGVQTLPNGLGMGGQLDYFGLWIDQSFNIGHSKAQPKCTTYGSPQLSAKPEFQVDIVEVWGVGKNPQEVDSDDEDTQNKQKSILDRDPESKAMLELLGKTQVSEGLREPEEEVMTEELKKKYNTIQKLI
ncbi:hypothetical protein ScPMuIL_001293 [Solemya velum]